ncbi:MAG: hypothetical protein A4E73_03380 [Syntrophaceae bacterium PtaU1.Bin231]|nr:MAG: hypothetical protein A4E73_03380 [Syntrophaceae bacterium PtaU1.Bin231]
MEEKRFRIILFKSVSYAMKAEKILQAEGIPFKLIPIPKEISPDCGICLRIAAECETAVREVLAEKVEISGDLPYA